MSATSLELAKDAPIQGEIGITVRDEDVVFTVKRHQFDITPITFAIPFLQLDMIFQQRLAKSIEARATLQQFSHSPERKA